MRQVKCKRCEKKSDKDKAYLYVHVTSGGNKQNRYYCNEQCYKDEQNDIFMLKQCQYFVDEIVGYVCVNNAKNKGVKELIDAGYTREEIYDCMLELKTTILEALEYKNIQDEYAKIQYMFAIIKGRIREITLNNKITKKNREKISEFEEIEYIPYETSYKSANKRKSLSEKLGRK